jgi:CCR4-NOT transcriptional complex subunit CAF120
MFEHATLQEAYTGSLIAGKGKMLNNIKVIMEKTRLTNEDWTRVRFRAGTPWRRCWCVISPPDDKGVQKQQKQLRKKSAYERAAPLRGSIKFYDTKKTKKAQPIATINDAYSAYAIYPQSKPFIDQSTLVKIEGSITIHSTPESTTDGFVFVMPEVHPAVSGLEMMLRYLFPVYDVFALYGRPNRLVADTFDTRSLMFAMPQEKRYGYLEILDVAGLIHETGSQSWNERQWRLQLKELTSTRMTRMTQNGRPRSRASIPHR